MSGSIELKEYLTFLSSLQHRFCSYKLLLTTEQKNHSNIKNVVTIWLKKQESLLEDDKFLVLVKLLNKAHPNVILQFLWENIIRQDNKIYLLTMTAFYCVPPATLPEMSIFQTVGD